MDFFIKVNTWNVLQKHALMCAYYDEGIINDCISIEAEMLINLETWEVYGK